MSNMIKFYVAALLSQVSYRAAAADTQSIQHEIDVFLSTGLGHVVFIILTLLFLLWLLLPLAVFGLKSKLNAVIKQTRETNRILDEIRSNLSALNSEETLEDYPIKPQRSDDQNPSADLYEQIKFDA